jgi:hypothetical protein
MFIFCFSLSCIFSTDIGGDRSATIRKIDKRLDQLQENLMKELTEKENGITIETRELLVSLDEKQKELSEHQINIVSIKKYASDLQAYLAVKQIEKDVETEDRCLQTIVNSDSLNQTKLSYKIL